MKMFVVLIASHAPIYVKAESVDDGGRLEFKRDGRIVAAFNSWIGYYETEEA